jgi:uncharacterized Zn ribbon protein
MTKLSEKKHIAEELEKQMKEEQKMSEMSQSSKPQNGDPNTSFKRKKVKKGRGKSIKNGTRIILSQSKKNLKGAEFQQDSIINMKTSSNFFKPGGRAYSANVYGNPKLRRYEQVIMKIKKMIVSETSKLRDIKTIYSKEIESKTQLEQLLRQ